MAKKAKGSKTRFDAKRKPGGARPGVARGRGPAKAAAKPSARKAPAPAKKRQTKAEAEALLKSGPVRRRRLPEQGELVDDLRIAPLDRACKNIAATRRDINDAKAEEASLEQNALSLMRKHNVTHWSHAGVDLTRVPGTEKLLVKTSRSNATAKNQGGDEGGDAGGDGEQAGDGDVFPMDGAGTDDLGNPEPAGLGGADAPGTGDDD